MTIGIVRKNIFFFFFKFCEDVISQLKQIIKIKPKHFIKTKSYNIVKNGLTVMYSCNINHKSKILKQERSYVIHRSNIILEREHEV